MTPWFGHSRPEPQSGWQAPDVADCLAANCLDEIGAVSAACQTCLFAVVGQPYDVIYDACRDVGQGGVVNDGHNGLALLSRHPIASTERLDLESVVFGRSILHAVIEAPTQGSIDVYCTHLQRGLLGTYPTNGPFADASAENLAQAQALVDWVDATATSPTRVLMGAYNHGTRIGSIRPSFPDSYDLVRAAGYADPITDRDDVACSACDANLLIGTGGEGGILSDHVYLDQTSGEDATAELVFGEPLEVIGADGNPRSSEMHRSFTPTILSTMH